MFTLVALQPTRIGAITLSYCVVLFPLTHVRNTSKHVLTELGVESYA